jgi:hypothetical protein
MFVQDPEIWAIVVGPGNIVQWIEHSHCLIGSNVHLWVEFQQVSKEEKTYINNSTCIGLDVGFSTSIFYFHAQIYIPYTILN